MRLLTNPTTDDRKTSDDRYEPSDEERTWPERAKVLSLVQLGMTMADALSCTPVESDIYISIHNARRIPPDHRSSGGAVMATREQVLAALRG